MNHIKISASLLCADPLNLEDNVRQLEAAGADMLHIDMMDGNFVPNLGISIRTVKALGAKTSLPMECHLMMYNPGQYIDTLAEAGASSVTVHCEALPHLQRVLSGIRSAGMKAGVALNPSTPLSALDYVLDDIDMVTIMSVNPGFYGQKFIPAVMGKIKDARCYLDACGYSDIDILVDGNVSFENIPSLVEAGATMLVGGSFSAFRKGYSIAGAVGRMRELCNN